MTKAVWRAIKSLERNGRLTPQVVVRAATNPSSPLHAYFEWNDGKAAAAYRIEQARALIREVKIVFRTRVTKFNVVAYVRDPCKSSNQQGYASVVRLREEPANAKEVLYRELEWAISCLHRAKGLAQALKHPLKAEAIEEAICLLRTRCGMKVKKGKE